MFEGSQQGSQRTAEALSPPVSNLPASLTAIQIERTQVIRLFPYRSVAEITEASPQDKQETIKDILNDAILQPWKNQELWKDVQDCLRNNLQLSEICEALKDCLEKAQHSLLILGDALQQVIDQEELEEKLKNFKAAVNPSLDKLRLLKEELTLEKLQLRIAILDNKFASVKFWRDKLKVISFVALFIGGTSFVTLIISLTPLFRVPPYVVTAVITFISGYLGGPVQKWFDSFWKGYEDTLEAQMKLIDSMRRSTYDAITDLIAIKEVETDIHTLTQKVDIAPRDGEPVKISVEKIEKASAVLLKKLGDLTLKSERCSQNVERASTDVLTEVTEYANTYTYPKK